MLKSETQKFSIPPKLKFTYEDFIPIAETSSYRIYEAKPRGSPQKHIIRILDKTKEFVRRNHDLAATLFIQELLRLQYLYPGSVLLHTLEISEEGKQIACATLPYVPLSIQFDEAKEIIKPGDSRTIEKLLSDVLCEIEFFWKDLEIKKVMDVLGPENICYFKEKDGFFLSNWGRILENSSAPGENTEMTHTQVSEVSKSQLTSKELAAEIKALAFLVLKLKKIDDTDLKQLSQMPNLKSTIYDYAVKETIAEKFKDSKRMQNLIEKMLSLNPQNLPSLEELKSKEPSIQTSPSPGLEESKISKKDSVVNSPINMTSSVTEQLPSKLLTWCSSDSNTISVFDLGTKQKYAKFIGVNLKNKDGEYSWTHVKEIPNTKLLVSLNHCNLKSASLRIFDIAQKDRIKKVYSLDEVSGVTGQGDVTYNSRRNILGAIPINGKVSYHLFNVDISGSNTNDVVKLSRQSKWYDQHVSSEENRISSFDFDPSGESAAVIDRFGICSVLDINTEKSNLHRKMCNDPDILGRCRWSTNTGEPLLFVKFGDNRLNVIDVQKGANTMKNPFRFGKDTVIAWIDVCQSNGNLLAAAGKDMTIKIYDRRNSQLAKTIDDIHKDMIACVRWNESGDMLVSASSDKTAKLIEFKTGKVLTSGVTPDQMPARSVCLV